MKAVILRTISAMILGIILGSAVTVLQIGSQLDDLSLKNRNLEEQLADVKNELQKSKDTSKIKKKLSINTVEAFLLLENQEELSDYDRIAVELETSKEVKKWLKPIIGQEIEEIDSLLIPRIVDNREVESNGNKYRLKTYVVVVNQKTCVYVKATPQKPDSASVP